MNSTTDIGSWLDVAKLVQECSDGSWVFRGESSVGRPLLPKAGRVGSYSGAARKREYVLADEKKALEAFKKQARPHLNHTPVTDTEWLAIAQHHGMSTRLLDWTESLLVATYFAACQAGARGDAVVYGVRGLEPLTPMEESDPFLVTAPGLYRPPHISPRIPAQRSVFTVHANPTERCATGRIWTRFYGRWSYRISSSRPLP